MSDEPRDYYVTMIRGKRVALLAGPFADHAFAKAHVRSATDEATRIDPWACFDVFGTSSLPQAQDNPRGVLNDALNVVPRRIGP
jgi:hypothetical protein